MSKRIRGIVLAGLGALAVALAGAAGAEEVSGDGVMIAKDVSSMTVTLEGGIVLHVSDDTEISRSSGAPVGFGDLAVARAFGGGLEVNGENYVMFKGRSSTGKAVQADAIMVMEMLD